MRANRPAGHRRTALLLAPALAALSLLSCDSRSSPAVVHARSTAEVTADLRSDVEYLASDELSGRMLGEDGISAAEEYIAERFAEAGLLPLPGLDDYFQDFAVTRTVIDPEGVVLEIGDTRLYQGVPGRDFVPLRYSRDADLAEDLVFAGYGISAPSFGHDDYGGLNVRGNIVLVLRGEPETDDPNSPFFGEDSTVHAQFKTKAEVAYRHGAIGIVVVNPIGRPERTTDFTVFPVFELDDPRYRPPPELTAQIGGNFPVLWSSSALLQWTADQWGVSAAELVGRMDAGITPGSLGLRSFHARVGVDQVAPESGVPARNVAGLFVGEDEDRYVIVGAHHDHLGAFGGEESPVEGTVDDDRIFNGADDNASGVAVVLEVARRLQDADLGTNVVLVTFSAEEPGLLGSTAFVMSGIVDPSRVDLMINVDMAGRNAPDPVLVYQGGDSPIPRSNLQAIADSAELPVTIHTEPIGRDDSVPFEYSGIPTIFPFSGFHEDYHGVDDEADRLDYDRLASVTDFVIGVILTTAGE
jgi:hypothetical protein